jgi:hypothetical protein
VVLEAVVMTTTVVTPALMEFHPLQTITFWKAPLNWGLMVIPQRGFKYGSLIILSENFLQSNLMKMDRSPTQ